MGDPPGAGELERQQRQQPADRGDDPGAGVAGAAGQGGQVQVHQVGDDQQQPGPGGIELGRPGVKVDDRCPGQARVAARGARRDAFGWLRAAYQPAEPLLGEDLADTGAVQRPALGGQPGGDLVGGQALPPQLDDPAAGPVLSRGRPGRRARLAGRGEQVQLPGAELAHQADHRPPGVAEPLPGLGVGQALGEPGAQRLVAAVIQLCRGGEPPRLPALRRSGCHMASLPHLPSARSPRRGQRDAW